MKNPIGENKSKLVAKLVITILVLISFEITPIIYSIIGAKGINNLLY